MMKKSFRPLARKNGRIGKTFSQAAQSCYMITMWMSDNKKIRLNF